MTHRMANKWQTNGKQVATNKQYNNKNNKTNNNNRDYSEGFLETFYN